jgi:urea transporter
MIELLILGKLWGIRRDTAMLSGSDYADIEAGVFTLGFILSMVAWPLLLAWPMLKVGVPRWIAFLLAVAVGVAVALLVPFLYFGVGLTSALIGLTMLIVKYG